MTTGGTAAARRARAATHIVRACALFAVRHSAALSLVSLLDGTFSFSLSSLHLVSLSFPLFLSRRPTRRNQARRPRFRARARADGRDATRRDATRRDGGGGDDDDDGGGGGDDDDDDGGGGGADDDDDGGGGGGDDATATNVGGGGDVGGGGGGGGGDGGDSKEANISSKRQKTNAHSHSPSGSV
jgi:hypothetical protein